MKFYLKLTFYALLKENGAKSIIYYILRIFLNFFRYGIEIFILYYKYRIFTIFA